MVSFKKLFLATSLFLSGVAAVPATQGTGLNVLEKRVEPPKSTTDANHICEQQFVTKSTIQGNSNSATAVDLTGCSAFFFYDGSSALIYAAHIFCGNIATDGRTIAETAADMGAESCTYAALSDYEEATKKAITDAGLTINTREDGYSVLYTTTGIPSTDAVTVEATTGTKNLVQGTAQRTCSEPEKR